MSNEPDDIRRFDDDPRSPYYNAPACEVCYQDFEDCACCENCAELMVNCECEE